MLLIPPSEICMWQVTCEKRYRSQRTWLFPELPAKMVLKWSRLQQCHPHQYLAGELAGVGPVVNLPGAGGTILSMAFMGYQVRTTALKRFGPMGCTDYVYPDWGWDWKVCKFPQMSWSAQSLSFLANANAVLPPHLVSCFRGVHGCGWRFYN